jgi:riboflavin kinase/FMN adenylyltransferase
MKFSGVVKKNLGRGTELGFPTANMDAPKEIDEGIYVGQANEKPALIFIGAAETFDETDRKAEVYILDFSGDLYGQILEIELLKKIRGNQKFDSKEELIAQMMQDEKQAREFFGSPQ